MTLPVSWSSSPVKVSRSSRRTSSPLGRVALIAFTSALVLPSPALAGTELGKSRVEESSPTDPLAEAGSVDSTTVGEEPAPADEEKEAPLPRTDGQVPAPAARVQDSDAVSESETAGETSEETSNSKAAPAVKSSSTAEETSRPAPARSATSPRPPPTESSRDQRMKIRKKKKRKQKEPRSFSTLLLLEGYGKYGTIARGEDRRESSSSPVESTRAGNVGGQATLGLMPTGRNFTIAGRLRSGTYIENDERFGNVGAAMLFGINFAKRNHGRTFSYLLGGLGVDFLPTKNQDMLMLHAAAGTVMNGFSLSAGIDLGGNEEIGFAMIGMQLGWGRLY